MIVEQIMHFGFEETSKGNLIQKFFDLSNSSINTTLYNPMIEKVSVYYMNGSRHEFNTATDKNIQIFINATPNKNGNEFAVESETLLSIPSNYNVFLQPEERKYMDIKDNGIVIAQYSTERNELYILTDLLHNHTTPEHASLIFEAILKEYKQRYLSKLQNRTSWVYGENPMELLNSFKARFERINERQIRRLKDEIYQHEEAIHSYKREIANQYRNLITKRQQLEFLQKTNNNPLEKLAKELDLIKEHEKVKDIHIKDGKFIIQTVPLYIYHDGERYNLGECKIEIELQNTDIKFFTSVRRRSYWSDADYHPHVNNYGRACLGNVASTIAELCSQNELYALYLVAIDFLESVNTSDPAGKNVVNWDTVDDEGNIIPAVGTDDEEAYCEECDEYYHVDDIHFELPIIDRDGDRYTVTICRHCLESYRYDEERDIHVHEDYEEDEEDDDLL